ncbi:DUF5924 family protein [Pseudomonas cannabina]|uniref:DUF2914 domain-containing protein n=1 Tax=Pseudomonas cannabina TaxID=86840 RepID=A0A0P9N742_PSECA|nr:DUF5924 family protein [Pseudomonas cannabina]KAA8710274.1 DUF2914 domain-containing protein [Pseudomonas cannabina]KPW67058.1 Uncharacterized protein ALO81_01876 [Pseudomonas cannabina]RMN20079.1 hypothetical protein ALQ64_04345 [Pseudomonas cannabina]SDR39812.1 Protein of unknown function [Pseudomonas cannabina]
MLDLNRYVTPVLDLMQRYPGLIAAFGFVSGIASFILVDRQESLATWIAVVMLISWLWLMIENTMVGLLNKALGREIPQGLLRYGTQMIHQESLFFVLPFFFITTTWNSGQAVFTAVLGAAGLISIIDPLYYKWLAPRRWLFMTLHTLTLFAALLTALPIILHLTTAESYKLALGVAMLLSAPSLMANFPLNTWRSALTVITMILAIGAAGWLLRFWVPPATLWLTEVAVSPDFDNKNRTPGDSISLISARQLRNGGLYAYTAINAPRGLDERIYHVWWHEGQEMDRIALDIHGGRTEGYRAWTRKQNFPQDVTGRWQVRVLTEDGQMIGVLRFVVTDNDQPAVKRPTGRLIKLKPGGDSSEEAVPEAVPAQPPASEPRQNAAPAPAEAAPPESPPAAPAP